jgi:hypothetical protein
MVFEGVTILMSFATYDANHNRCNLVPGHRRSGRADVEVLRNPATSFTSPIPIAGIAIKNDSARSGDRSLGISS